MEEEVLSDILFVDNVLLIEDDTQQEIWTLNRIVSLFCDATGMVINLEKYCLLLNHVSNFIKNLAETLFPYPLKDMSSGFKYLGFHINPNSYA